MSLEIQPYLFDQESEEEGEVEELQVIFAHKLTFSTISPQITQVFMCSSML